MSFVVTDVDERVTADQESFSTNTGLAEADRRKPHPCFADNEFGSILRVLAEDESEVEK